MIILWSEGDIAKKMVFEVPHIKPRDMFGVEVGEVIFPWTMEKMTCLYKVYGRCAMQDKVADNDLVL